MPYITISVKPKSTQISFDDILSNISNPSFFLAPVYETDFTNETRTAFREFVPPRLLEQINVDDMISSLVDFCDRYKELIGVENKSTLYRSFKIPKRSGGLRPIDAPLEPLMFALRDLKYVLEAKCYANHHTAAFAYIKHRSPVVALKRHQKNNSRWFLKLDFQNFFTRTTPEFLMDRLETIFPFSEIVKIPVGKTALSRALSLCFLNGGLPQGTPISPLLTNVMMIPIDLEISKYAREHSPHLCYTRYADDLLISGEFSFDWKKVQNDITEILRKFNAPFSLKSEKTRYGSSAGRNWNLGLMLNKDNEITIGHQKKKVFKVMIYNFLNDYTKGTPWNVSDTQHLGGLISYYTAIEKKNIEDIIKGYEEKFSLQVNRVIKEILGQK